MYQYIFIYSSSDDDYEKDLAEAVKMLGNVQIQMHCTDMEWNCWREVRGKVVIAAHALSGYITRHALAVIEFDGVEWYCTGTIDVPAGCPDKLRHLENGGFVSGLPEV